MFIFISFNLNIIVSKQKKFIKLMFKSKPLLLLLSLRDGPKYATIISKRIDCTYSHTIKLLDEFEKLGLVKFEKRGRIKLVYLTNEGEKVLKGVEELLKRIE